MFRHVFRSKVLANVPQSHGVVDAAGGQEFSVRGERQRRGDLHVPPQRMYRKARAGVANFNGSIWSAKRQEIGETSHAAGSLRMLPDHSSSGWRLQIADGHAALAEQGHGVAFLAPGQAVQRAQTGLQRTLARTSLPAP